MDLQLATSNIMPRMPLGHPRSRMTRSNLLSTGLMKVQRITKTTVLLCRLTKMMGKFQNNYLINGEFGMSKLSEKMKYMALGALIALSGFMLGSFNDGTDAQSRTQMIDELAVKTLYVFDEIIVVDSTQVNKKAVVLINYDENGGQIKTYSKRSEKGHASMGVDQNGGQMRIYPNTGNSGAAITTTDDMKTSLTIFPKQGRGTVSLGTHLGNGVMWVNSKDGVGGVTLTAFEGKGVTYTTDKFGRHSTFLTE